MSLCVLNKFTKANFHADPFPHILIERAVDDRIYKELERVLTHHYRIKLAMQMTQGGRSNPEHRYRFSKYGNGDWVLGRLWEDFMEYHTSQEFVEKTLGIFSDNVKKINFDFYNMDNFYLRGHQPDNLSRQEKGGAVVSDCQLVIHKPLGLGATTRTAHIDSFKELYAGLLYMKPGGDKSSGGDLELYSSKHKKAKFIKNSHREVDLSTISRAKIIPYSRNTFAMFLNAPNAVHSVSPRVGAEKNRFSVNIIAERLKSKFFTI